MMKSVESHIKIMTEPSPSIKLTVSYFKIAKFRDHGSVGVNPKSQISVNGK